MDLPLDNISKVDLIIGESGAFYVLSDHFFNKPVGWLEYDVATASLDFIMEDGEIRNYGVPIKAPVAAHLQNQTGAFLVKGTIEDIQEHAGYAVIVHR